MSEKIVGLNVIGIDFYAGVAYVGLLQVHVMHARHVYCFLLVVEAQYFRGIKKPSIWRIRSQLYLSFHLYLPKAT
jgi:hypothetical protein